MIRPPTPRQRILHGVLALFCLPVGGAVALLGISAALDPGGPRLLGVALFFAGAFILLLGFKASSRSMLPAEMGGTDLGSVLLLRIVSWLVLSFFFGVFGALALLLLVVYTIR